MTADAFLEQVEQNLNQGKMRLIIATNNLHPEVRKVIEYLNAETRNIEVLGLEISFYGDDESAVLVPTVVGQSQIVAAKKRGADKTTKWEYPLLIEEFDKLDNPVTAERLKKIAAWANEAELYTPVISKGPAFAVRSKHGLRLFSFSTTGIYCYLTPKHHGDSVSERDNFVQKLKELPIFNYTDSDLRAKEGRNAPGTIESLSEKEFVRFMIILKEISN